MPEIDAMDPSTDWRAVRVTSSTAIQPTVTAALLHLADPSSTPLVLHTLPSPSPCTSFSIIPKNTHASLCKLISIVEIIKREFEDHQKAVWRLEDEKEQRRLNRRSSKGKKRAREEDEVSDIEKNIANESRADEGAAPTTQDAIKDTLKQSKKASKDKDKKQKKKDRPLLRIYQYNLLDAYERLPGAPTSQEGEAGGTDSESDSPHDDVSDNDNAEEDARIEADLVKSKLKAAKSLDDAIKTHVIRARRRPRKKHTPYMKIILSIKKLPEYENYLKSSSTSSTSTGTKPTGQSSSSRPKDYTIQLPIKKKSRTRSKDARKRSEKGRARVEGVANENTKTTTEGRDEGKIVSEGVVEPKGKDKDKGKERVNVTEDTKAVAPSEMEGSGNSQAKKRKHHTIIESSQNSSEATQLSSQIVPSA